MKTLTTLSRSLIAIAVTVALAGCASAPKQPAGSAEVRAKLTALVLLKLASGEARWPIP